MPDFGRWNANGGDPSLSDINRSDQFLDALASGGPVYAADQGEAELADLLAGWRDDIRETPTSVRVTPQQAAQALERAGSSSRRRRLSLAVVGSTAAAVLCLGGFGAVIAGAGPGDALYGLRTILFGEQASPRDDAVILAAQTEMQEVQQLIDQGDWQAAQAKLEAVTTTVATVGDVERKEELVSQWQELTVKVEAQDAAATVPPGAPLPSFPELPAVVLDPLTPASETSGTSGTSGTSTTSETSETSGTSGTETTAPTSETTAPSATTSAPTSGTTAPSSTEPEEATSPSVTTSTAPSTSGSPRATTTAPSATTTTPSSAAATAPSSADQSTSTSVVTRASSSAAPSATPSGTPGATATTTAAAPSAAVEEVEEPASSPAAPPVTTTTVLPVAPIVPDEPN
ncbi:anti-sigma-D factor RsdA [Mycolicibacterium poriferae]|uniref:anti-sigma-D factor RsdA n=1 Tax=Mycolicibacterium poriferae TaxID=39694 RepID=UPI0024B90FDF|nr:anti-sigma-D factor RsdA [Mycolicibacterium poriferae]